MEIFWKLYMVFKCCESNYPYTYDTGNYYDENGNGKRKHTIYYNIYYWRGNRKCKNKY